MMKNILILFLSIFLFFGSVPMSANGVLLDRTQQHFESLQSALVAARNGDTLFLEPGIYTGNFVIDKALTLKSSDDNRLAVLDGNNFGTVVTIRSDDVTLQNLQILHSGISPRYNKREGWIDYWGDSGIIVYPHNRIIMKKLLVSRCDDGITVLGSRNFEISDSVIKNNHLSGIEIQGSIHGRVERNRIEKNEYAIEVQEWHKQKRLLKSSSDFFKNAVESSQIEIGGNKIVGNGYGGIFLYAANHILIEKNLITQTGIGRKPDYKASVETYRWFSFLMGQDVYSLYVSSINRLAGTGISLTCNSHDNTVKNNLVLGNYSFGIDIEDSHKTEVSENRISGNHDGVYLSNGSRNNQINSNVIEENLQCGIGISCYDKYLLRPYENVIFSNDIQKNRFNAYDIASRELSREEILSYVKKWDLWLSAKEKEQVLGNPERLKGHIESLRISLFKLGHNRWDDGRRGNHYSNFDEAEEGFVDRNGDGIGERPYPIPGGSSVDRFPLDAASVADLEEKVPAAGYRPLRSEPVQ